jgi:membrane associated rhomboid family serine protease
MTIDDLLELSATYAIIALSVAVSLVGFWALPRKNNRRWFVFRAYDVARGKNLVGALLSHFAHGDFGHLLLNMLVLYLFGPRVEGALGFWPFLALYAVSGLAGTLAVFGRHYKNRNHSALGASGAIAGVVFAVVVIAPGAEFSLFFLPIGIPAPVFAVLYLAASSLMTGRGDNVAHEAHLGGALTGLVMAGLLYGPGFRPLIHAVTRLLS